MLDAHRRFLSDRNRVAAYQHALNKVITPESRVLDLGSGTGILGLLACNAGAREVFAVEATGMTGLAREICRANGCADRMHFIRGLSTEIELPGPVDVIVTDQINEFCFGAGLLEFLSDAARRCLAPDGVTVPGPIELLVAPVAGGELRAEIDVWSQPVADLDFSAVVAIAANQPRPFPVRREHLLGQPVPGARIDAAQNPEVEVEVRARSTVTRDGELDGIAGFFAAHLAPNVVMTNSPAANDVIDRWGLLFPLQPSIPVRKGDEVAVDIRVHPADEMYTWNVSVADDRVNSIRVGRGSTFFGSLFSSEDLTRSRSDHRPTLTRRAVALKSVVELCDGQHTIDQIEAEIARRHPDVFGSTGAIARTVAEIVASHCRLGS